MQHYRKIALKPKAIADAIAYAVNQPEDVDTSDIVVRPVASSALRRRKICRGDEADIA